MGLSSQGIKTINSQHSVAIQSHHAAHGYTLSKEEGPRVLVQRGLYGNTLRLPVRFEYGMGGETVATYDSSLFYDEEEGALKDDTVSAGEMGLAPAEIWRLIEYYKLYNAAYNAEEVPGTPSPPFLASQALYEGLRDSVVLPRALAFLEERERKAARAAKEAKYGAPITSGAYWRRYLEEADKEREKATVATVAAVATVATVATVVPVGGATASVSAGGAEKG